MSPQTGQKRKIIHSHSVRLTYSLDQLKSFALAYGEDVAQLEGAGVDVVALGSHGLAVDLDAAAVDIAAGLAGAGRNCRICYAGPPVVTTEDVRERINKVSNGEYELVGEYTNSRTEVEILHKGCGKVFKCRLNKFVDKKKKCPYCDKGNETLWNRGYEKLVEYKNNFGIVDVPKNLTFNGYHLGRWCLQQKIYYNKGELPQRRVDKLKSIEFVFNPLEEEWNRRYGQYKRYVYESGSLHIPKQTVYDGENLGAWILTQKHRYKEGKLSEVRVKKLEAIDKDIFKNQKNRS